MHSLLITDGVKLLLRRVLAERFALFRLYYVIFSVITIIPVVVYQAATPQRELFAWPGPWRFIQLLLLLYGVVMLYLGGRVYDQGYFIGIKQWQAYRAGRTPVAEPFKRNGILKYVRHPWYSGGIALVAAAGRITDVSLTAKIVLVLYLLIGTLLEERRLIREIGEPYRRYCREVPMLIPRKIKAAASK